MPISNVVSGTTITSAWGDSVADEVNALGNVETAKAEANQTIANATESDLTGLSVSFTLASTRMVKVIGSVVVESSIANRRAILRAYHGATQMAGVSMHLATTGVVGQCVIVLVATKSLTAATYTIKLTLAQASGTGTVESIANANAPAFLIVEDLGPG
jgi:chorismate mutase